jgi:hypothetical protein
MSNKWFKNFSVGIVLLSASQSYAAVDFTKDLMPLFEGMSRSRERKWKTCD